VKKYQLVLIVAFALSLGLTFLYFAKAIVFSHLIDGVVNTAYSVISTIISTIYNLFGIAVFFGVFYFLANRRKIIVMKSTVLALLFGVFLGTSIPYMFASVLNLVAYGGSSGRFLEVLAIYLFQIFGSFVYGFSLYVFPALTALLYVELREKKSNHNLPEENVQGSK
jgi:hypothetical protein